MLEAKMVETAVKNKFMIVMRMTDLPASIMKVALEEMGHLCANVDIDGETWIGIIPRTLDK